MRTPRLDRALAIALLLIAVVASVVTPFLAGGSGVEGESVVSRTRQGRLALALVLRELGFRPEGWRGAPGRLPSGPHLVWAPCAPRSFDARFERPEPEDEQGEDEPEASETESDPSPGDAQPAPPRDRAPTALAVHAPHHYRAFVEQGGTLILPAGEATGEFLAALDLAALASAARGPAFIARDRLRTTVELQGEAIAIDWPAWGVLETLPESVGATPLGLLDGTRWLGWSAPLGAGTLVVLGDDAFAQNGGGASDVDQDTEDEDGDEGGDEDDARAAAPIAGIGEAQHGLLAVRLVERFGRGGRLLLDEYALGRWHPESALRLSTTGQRGVFVAQLVLVLLLLAWRTAWVREFPRDPEPLAALSPLVRAQAQAALYRRAGRFDLLAKDLVRGALSALARRSARAGGSAGHDLEPLIERVAPAAARPELHARWRALAARTVPSGRGGAAAFEALAAELAALERLSATSRDERASGIVGRRRAPTRTP